MKSRRIAPAGVSSRHRGFALVLALSIMAFTLLLLVSMTTLVQVETRAATNSLHALQARESARLALMLAIGQLQKHAGPDQRVTARADILGAGNFAPTAQFWTGVWDTTEPTAPPTWLVSGAPVAPSDTTTPSTELETHFYSSATDSAILNDFEATQVSTLTHDQGAYAWWTTDEGIKAAISVKKKLADNLSTLTENTGYLDYHRNSNKLLQAQHDSTFDFPLLFDINTTKPPTVETLKHALTTQQAELLAVGKTQEEQGTIRAMLKHDYTLRNRFVLSDPLNGGLKKDLSFLKTFDASSTSQAQLDALYNEPDQLITPDVVDLIQFRGNPTTYPSDEIIGMQIAETSAATTEAKANHFDLTPIITEFQFSMGVAATDGNVASALTPDSALHLVHKVYLELWNPYTVPILIGDPSMSDHRGFSDIAVEIQNLPSYRITNIHSGDTAAGTLPDLRIKWSDHASAKVLRPGMVYRTSLPLDPGSSSNPHGDHNSGTIQLPLGTSIIGSRADDYSGQFTFTDAPIEISLKGINSSNQEREICTTAISNYADFTIDYNYNSYTERAMWLKRVPTSSEGKWGMNTVSLEVPGYAFAFRYRMLDEQELPGPNADLSKWLSDFDIRNRQIEVDLNTWDINDAWDSEPPLPYDFNVNATDTDLSTFEPDESFKDDHFFHYNTSSTYNGRRDRIARFIDLPIGELTHIGSLRALKYKNHAANALGNPWGGNLNEHYDRYFFSTLPNPNVIKWDGETPLANGRIDKHISTPQLDDTDAAQQMFIENGINLNTTSQSTWKSLLSSKSFAENEYEFCYEQAEPSAPSEWGELPTSLNRITVGHPQAMLHNLCEKPESPRYEFLSRAHTNDYLDAFSIDNISWHENLQYPAFYQSIRELSEADIEALSHAIVEQLQAYTTENGHPPLSMAEWLNSGLLQTAIDSVPSLNNRESDTDLIPAHSPAHISQATLLNALEQFAFVRSDTFRIRAYGASTHSTTNAPHAESYIEAVLQRLPDEHIDRQFGRQFKILSMHWIQPTNEPPL